MQDVKQTYQCPLRILHGLGMDSPIVLFIELEDMEMENTSKAAQSIVPCLLRNLRCHVVLQDIVQVYLSGLRSFIPRILIFRN